MDGDTQTAVAEPEQAVTTVNAASEPPAGPPLPPEAAHAALPGVREWHYYARGGRFYTTNSAGDWVWVNEETCRLMLVQDGVSDALLKEDRAAGERLTECDKRIIDIKTERIVKYAGLIAGWKRGLHQMNGAPVLVTEELQLIEPRPAPADARARSDGSCRGWPLLGGQFERWLSSRGWYWVGPEMKKYGPGVKPPANARPEDEGYDQRAVMFAWLARWYGAALDGHGPMLGQAMVLAGGTGCGKTLFVQLLERIFGGASAQPYQWLMGGQFNSDLVGAAVLTIDDEVSKTDMKSRKDLGARVKQFVAVPKIRIEGKGVDAIVLSPGNRLIFCTNLTEDNLSVLPPPSEDLVDADGRSGKIILSKFYSHGWEGPFGTEAEKRAFIKSLVAELPYFLHWLLHEFQLPETLYDERYGVIPWMHPEILEMLEELSPWQRILSLVDRALFIAGKPDRYIVTAEKLHTMLTDEDNPLPAFERQQLRQHYLHLDEIAKKRPDRCVNLRSRARGKLRAYAIFAEGARRQDEAEEEWVKNELSVILAAKASRAKAVPAGGVQEEMP